MQNKDNMADQNMQWMTRGPLALQGVFHKMPRHEEKLLTEYHPNIVVKAEDHPDMFYLHQKTLELFYDDLACRLFPCTLDDRVAVCYHGLPTISIQNWGILKRIFLEKFVVDKTPVMLLKDLVSLKME